MLTPLAVDPGHPFPVHLQPVAVARGGDSRYTRTGTRALRARQGAEEPSALGADSGAPTHFVPLEHVIGAQPRRAVSGHGGRAAGTRSGSRATPTSSSPTPRSRRTCSRRSRSRSSSGGSARSCVSRSRRACRTACASSCSRSCARTRPDSAALLAERGRAVDAGPLLELGDLMRSPSLDIPELRDPPFAPVDARRSCATTSVRSSTSIRERDVLVHHPFDSFTTTVERFLEEAADDHERARDQADAVSHVGRHGRSCARSTEAAQRGKQVAVLVELKARFDESNNITWARTLESVRRPRGVRLRGDSRRTRRRRWWCGARRTASVATSTSGTGNYNSRTARLYTDVGLFTCSPSIGADVSDLFNSLTGFSRQRLYRKLLVAPADMRERFLELIEREAAHARAGRPARIVAKMNALVDPEMIDALYAASQDGVRDRSPRARHLLPASGSSGAERRHPGDQHRRAVSRALAPLATSRTAARRSTTSGRRTGCRATSIAGWRWSLRSRM